MNFTPIPSSPGLLFLPPSQDHPHSVPTWMSLTESSAEPGAGLINVMFCDCKTPFPPCSYHIWGPWHPPCLHPLACSRDREPEGTAGSGGQSFPAPSSEKVVPGGRGVGQEAQGRCIWWSCILEAYFGDGVFCWRCILMEVYFAGGVFWWRCILLEVYFSGAVF